MIAKYEKENPCCDGVHSFKHFSYPKLKWNKQSKKWEIKKGFTKDQLPEESRQILEETSKLERFTDGPSEPGDIQKVEVEEEKEKVESCTCP